MTYKYKNDGLNEKKIEKILIRKIFSIQSKSTPTTIKKKSSQEENTTHTLGLSLRENPLSLLLVIYHFLPFTSIPQTVKVSYDNERLTP